MIVLGCSGSGAIAQGESLAGSARPDGARRVVALWDFEDALKHLEEVPQHWYRGHDRPPDRSRPGFPPFNGAAFDKTTADAGEVSMKLPTRGGSTSLILAGGVVAVLPEGDYAVVARVRTEGLVHARARVVAWFLDAKLNEIPGSRKFSKAIVTPGDWVNASVPLSGRSDAVWIQLELQVLQPDQLSDRFDVPGESQPEDFDGVAWFDDVAILQVPRLEINTEAIANVHIGNEPPTLKIVAQDLTGEVLRAELRVRDLRGDIVTEQEFELSSSGRAVSWIPPLDRYGWYSAELEVSNRTARVGITKTSFVWSPPAPPLEYVERLSFGLVLRSIPLGFEQELLGFIERMEVGRVNLPVWDSSLSLATIEAHIERVGAIADLLIERGVELTFTLQEMPRDLALQMRLDESQLIDLFTEPEEKWGPYIDRMLAVFGERVHRWQVGASGRGFDFWRQDLAGGITSANDALRRLVPRPTLSLPWMIEHRLDERTAGLGAATVTMPPDALADGLSQWAANWPEQTEITLLIEPMPRSEYDPWHSVVLLSKKLIRAREAGIERVATPELWTWERGQTVRVLPDPELAMWITLARKLAGREIVAVLPMPEGAHALIADGHRGGMLIAWNDFASPEDAVIRGYLSERAVNVTDIFGNTSYVEPVRYEHRIELDAAPIFIEGIDVEMALMRSRLRFDPGFISSRAQMHAMELVIYNPWETNLNGRLKLAEPVDWDVSPRVQSFTVAPGQEHRLSFELAFGIGEETGPHTAIAEMSLTTDHRYPTLRVPLLVEIGLDTVEFTADARLEDGPGGPLSDVIVTIVVQNIADVPQTMQAFIKAPGHAVERSPVSELQPGQIEVRHFRLKDGGRGGGARSLIDKKIRVGLKEQDGTGRLNQTIIVH